MTTTVQANPDTSSVPAAVVDLPDRAQMLRIIAEAVAGGLDAVAGGLPAPLTIGLWLHHTGTRSLDLRMDDNRAVDVDAWVRTVSPDGEASAQLGHHLFEGNDRSWRSYSYGDRPKVSWHGWTLYVWSAVDEPVTASAGAE